MDQTPPAPTQPEKKANKKIIFIIIAIVIIGGGIYFSTQGTDENSNSNSNSNAVTDVNTNTNIANINFQTNLEDAEYASEVVAITDIITEALTYIGELSTLEPDPAFWTEEETDNIDYYTAVIESAYDDAIDIEVPDKYKKFHALYTEALDKYAQAMPLYREAIDTLDVDLIDQSVDLLNEGNELLDQAAAVHDEIE